MTVFSLARKTKTHLSKYVLKVYGVMGTIIGKE